jgi:hypothetical protein
MHYANICGVRAVGDTIRRLVPRNRSKRLFLTSVASVIREKQVSKSPGPLFVRFLNGCMVVHQYLVGIL